MNRHIFLFLFLFLVGVILIFYKNTHITPNNTKTDTIIIVKYDTLRYNVPIYISKEVKDTIFVEVNKDNVKKDTTNNKDYVKLEREQIYYSEKGVYDAWVSGFKPRLDSFYVYNKEITNTIVENKAEAKRNDLFATFSVGRYMNNVKIGAGVDLVRNRFTFGGEVGVIENKFFFGLKIGVKIHEK